MTTTPSPSSGQDPEAVDVTAVAKARPIVTVTLNPAVDLWTTVPEVVPQHKLRCTAAVAAPGGGGINVARVADRLGFGVRAIALTGGASGDQLLTLATAEGIDVTPIDTGVDTRRSISVREQLTNKQFRFVFPGEPVAASAVESLRGELQALRNGAARPIVVFSGSLPAGIEPTVMTKLVQHLDFADVIVDTSGPALVEATRSTALLIKPSVGELEAMTGRPLTAEAEVVRAAEEVLARSAVGAMLVSLGGDGALLIRANGRPVRFRAPAVEVRSTIGAGDSMVGGVAVGLAAGDDLAAAAALGVAAGTAAVLTDGTELCMAAEVDRLRPLVVIEPIVGASGR